MPLGAGDAVGLALTATESEQLTSTRIARDLATAEAVTSLISTAAFGVSAYFPVSFLAALGQAARSTGESLRAIEGVAQHHAGLSALIGGYERRRQEWAFQCNAAGRELAHLDKQIVAGEVRVAVSRKELANHDTQLANARALDAEMHAKFTNDRLYSWMTDQLSRVFFSTYQLAADVARKAERGYKYELGVEAAATNYVQPGSWDSLRNGLLAGEKLSLDLKRLELAYFERNARELELTKHVSLLQLDPERLLDLKRLGSCDVDLPEWLFDLDCPGHYFRRLKTVSVSIPCVTGPYTSVNCTLTLVRNSIRWDPNSSGAYQQDANGADPRFRDDPAASQRMVTSSAVNDSGLFETNLRDDRYLPFEGRGAISSWRLELPTEFKSFDHDTIADVVLHVRYTARMGSEKLKANAVAHVKDVIGSAAPPNGAPRMRLVSLRHEFPSAWARLSAPGAPASRTETVILTRTSFPYAYSGYKLTVVGAVQFPTDGVVVAYQPLLSAGPIPETGLAITVTADEGMMKDLKDLTLILAYTVGS